MPKIEIDAKFGIGDRVTLAVDKAHVGLVDGYVVDNNSVLYRVSWSGFENKSHYGFELRADTDTEVGLHVCKSNGELAS